MGAWVNSVKFAARGISATIKYNIIFASGEADFWEFKGVTPANIPAIVANITMPSSFS